MVDKLSTEKRSWNMGRIKGKDTSPEVLVRSKLHGRGYRFRKNVKGMPGTPDIVLAKYNSVIFVNGCYWHRHQGCRHAYMPKSHVDFWEKKFEGTVNRDKKNIKALESEGWKVIVLWECDIRNKIDRLIDEVEKFLRSEVLDGRKGS